MEVALAGRVVPADPSRGLWALESRYDTRLVAICKSVPGLRWNGGARKWVGYRDAMGVLISRAALEGMTIAPASVSGGDLWGPDGWADNANAAERRPYQLEAATFLLDRGEEGALLGDAMGLGKTCSALTAASAVDRLIVVCPSYVRGVWRDELAKWAPSRDAFYPEGIKGRKTIPPECDTIILHYDILDAWADTLIGWVEDTEVALCFDEAHMLQSDTSKRAKAARRVAAVCSHRWGLTGTPLTNRPKDMWCLVDILSPGRFGSFFPFALRYCGAMKKEIGGDQ